MKLSEDRATNIGCLQRAMSTIESPESLDSTKTGDSFRANARIIIWAQPFAFVLQNLKDLLPVPKDSTISDATFITNYFAEHRYDVRIYHVCAQDRGSLAYRDRIFFIG